MDPNKQDQNTNPNPPQEPTPNTGETIESNTTSASTETETPQASQTEAPVQPTGSPMPQPVADDGQAPQQPMAAPAQSATAAAISTDAPQKDYLVAWLLSYFVGWLGVDRFYLGYTGLGIVKLLTLGGFFIWALIDWILIFAGVMKDANGQPLKDREKNFKLTVIIFIVLLVLGALGNFATIVSGS